MLEHHLIDYCSPTLASLKTANLFSCRFQVRAELNAALARWNAAFADKGVELILLKCEKTTALVYVCRRARLREDLAKPGVAAFLAEYGYTSTETQYAIRRLKQRLQTSDGFPHEIGVFLDYPLDDVKGFIEHAGANCKCVGCWKVYCNECEALKTFQKYKKCSEVYTRLFRSGARDVLQLTVAQ